MPPLRGHVVLCVGGGYVDNDSLLHLDGQADDLNIGDMAGGNIYHGLPADATVQMLARELDKESTYRLLDSKAREIRQRETDASMDRLYQELRLIRWTLAAAAILVVLILAGAVF